LFQEIIMDPNNPQNEAEAVVATEKTPHPDSKLAPLFTIKNSVRDPQTKTLRKISPGPNNLKQYLGGGQLRIIRGTGTRVTEGTLKQHLSEIVRKVERGELQVFAPNGEMINLVDLRSGVQQTERSIPLPPTKPTLPMPNFQPDSANNDKAGPTLQTPQFVGGDVAIPVDPNKKPELMNMAPRDEIPPPPSEALTDGVDKTDDEGKTQEGEGEKSEGEKKTDGQNEQVEDKSEGEQHQAEEEDSSSEESDETSGEGEGVTEEGGTPALMGGSPSGSKKKKKNKNR
jgi:hypothetical protein